MNLKRFFLLFCLLQTSCSSFNPPAWLHGQRIQMEQAHTTPPTKIPPGVPPLHFHTDYPLPQGGYYQMPAKEPVRLTPPGLFGP